jgi:hypothetical protein
MRAAAVLAVSLLLAASLGVVAGDEGDAADADHGDTTKHYESALPGTVIELSDATLKQAVQVSRGRCRGLSARVGAAQPTAD